MTPDNIAIFDYGAGNLFSLKAALERNGAQRVSIIRDIEGIEKFSGLVLPGVGNFDPAIRSIEPHKELLIQVIDDANNGGMPMLGICLGMEMLFNKSEEGILDGLKILDGEVVMFARTRVKIPHMGWNNLYVTRKDSKLLQGVNDGSWVYFVHSYYVKPKDKGLVAASSHYGIKIPAVVENGNLFGTQFHPEKSGSTGVSILRNFLKACSQKCV
ncbi:MAG: imidazole glycerol phosphate synthase subunit HisH [Nitrosopumilales archaeon]|nr:imidazole glycerol phosphate synthase subunit HisH [Nitrosopumilales archaeon]